jgi:hypothetical protein
MLCPYKVRGGGEALGGEDGWDIDCLTATRGKTMLSPREIEKMSNSQQEMSG